MLRAGVANKYTCGMITQDDGNEDIFYMTRGDAGLALSEGLRVTYERTTNTRGPIAHYVKVRDSEWALTFKLTQSPRRRRRDGPPPSTRPHESPRVARERRRDAAVRRRSRTAS